MFRNALLFVLCSVVACGPSGTGSDASTSDASSDQNENPGPDSSVPVDANMRDAAPPPPPTAQPGRHNAVITETRRIIPSAGLPMETVPLNSNNNLDVIRHSDGRVYLAWRTAPNHFASTQALIYVVSSMDEQTWRFEARFSMNRDLREPRFLSLNGSLFLYISRLGTNRLAFEPDGISVAERRMDGTWSSLEAIYPGRFIAWRTRTERGRPYMTAYLNGQNIYEFNGMPLDVHFLTTDDGRMWRPVGMNPTVYRGGGSETDFTIGDDGQLFAIIRNEAGDSTGFGSLVCRAANVTSAWTCTHDPKKYDSPYVFWHDGEAYLIGRRQLTATGNYDLGRMSNDPQALAVMYQLAYSQSPKRCSLWRFDQATNRIVYMLDLPSKGDTCFAGGISTSQPGEFAIYNYSSDVDGPEVPWNVGQEGPTYIYRHVLRFTRR